MKSLKKNIFKLTLREKKTKNKLKILQSNSEKSLMMELETTPSKKPHNLPYNFPNIWCPAHDLPIILVCTRPDCKYPRIFLCSKCLHQELSHVNEHTPLHIFEEFVNIIAKEDTPLLDTSKEDSKFLVNQMDANLNNYSDAIKDEQFNIKKVLNELNDAYQDKSEELISLIETQLTAHNDRFQERYQKLENELLIDDLSNAQLPKFKEISAEVSKLRNPEKQCEFLKQVLKKRQAWESACPELKELPKKSYQFYENMITQQMEIEPKLLNKDELIETWNKGLNTLVQKVLHQAQIGDKSLQESQYIWLNLKKIEDLELLCDEMLRPETLLCFKPKREDKFNADVITECLGKLLSLRALALDFSLLPLSSDDIKKTLEFLPDLKQLKGLEINLAGVALHTDLLPELLKNLQSCKSLAELSLNFSQNNLSNFSELIEGLADMKHLNDLNLNLSGNKIDGKTVEALINSLKALKHLENLGLNLSGFSLSGPALDQKSSLKLFSSFSELSALRKFSLDVGHNNLNDEHFTELADNLKRIPSLKHLELVINSNKLEERGARKLAKALTKGHVNWLYLNAHSNDLAAKGVEELLGFLAENRKWIKVEINLRNVGVNKNQANGFYQQFNQDKIKIIF